jgi:hypothetical protein
MTRLLRPQISRQRTPWTPKRQPGLRSWWSMLDRYQASGGRLTRLDDIGGGNRHWEPYGASVGPELVEVAGRPWARFDTTNHCGLYVPTNFASSAQPLQTVAVVFAPAAPISAASAAQALIGWSTSDQAVAFGAFTGNWADEILTQRYGPAHASWADAGGSIAAAPHILLLLVNMGDTAWRLHLDGGPDLRNQTTGTHTLITAGSAHLGRRHDGTSAIPFAGDVAEIVAASGDLNERERRRLEEYLARRWNIPLV